VNDAIGRAYRYLLGEPGRWRVGMFCLFSGEELTSTDGIATFRFYSICNRARQRRRSSHDDTQRRPSASHGDAMRRSIICSLISTRQTLSTFCREKTGSALSLVIS
jgi:hypothetical protein